MNIYSGAGVINKIYPQIKTIILTITNECNLDCLYCHNKPYLENKYKSNTVLSINDFKDIAYQYAQYLNTKKIYCGEFCFSGGEPLIVGIDYYKKIIEIEKEISSRFKNKIKFQNLIQTNGTLLNDSWINFIKENDIKLGISIDGIKNIQNTTRYFKNKKGSYNKIESILEKLKKDCIEFGFLIVVSKYNKKYASEIIKKLITFNPQSLAFIPCLDYDGKINSTEYSKFLITAFDTWISIRRYNIPIRNFKFVIFKMMGLKNIFIPCENSGKCPTTININLNKDVFICDVFMGRKGGYLGNLNTVKLSDLEKTYNYLKIRQKITSLPKKCKLCKFIEICNGGCFYRRQNNKKIDYLCKANISLFKHIENYLKKQNIKNIFKKFTLN
ncbi:MAG: radical SAM protein [Elusimicrobiales bacterium]|nr:radical SAM protein [Elusimicrobiales bacterium]